MPPDAPSSHAASAVAAPYGTLPSGEPVMGFTLTNVHGLSLHAIEYGGIITRLSAPDRAGAFADIVLGHDSLEGYLGSSSYFGAIVGRVANRIAGARFTLDGVTYALAENSPPNTLHGGRVGFDRQRWHGEAAADHDGARLTLRVTSPDGDEGFPGELAGTVTYSLDNDNRLTIEYEATPTRPTPVNLTHHAYFNLAGHDAGDIGAHTLLLHADAYTPMDAAMIPTGAIAPVDGTPFDFRVPTAIGARIDDAHPQLVIGRGYDHNWVINGDRGLLHPAARVVEPASGRTLEVQTTAPGLQCYTGNFLDGTERGKGGHAYVRRGGFSLETQHFPDAPNQPAFPTCIVRPGDTFRSRTVFAFGVTD
jgi:aldose 1-epimerase